jgi:hypothetical protein
MYRLRETQINAVTRYDHMGVIGMAHRGSGCFSWLKPPWHTRPFDIITTFKNNTSETFTLCSPSDYLPNGRFNQYEMDIFKFEEALPKNALIAKIDEPDRLSILKTNQGKKLNRRIRDLEKANQVCE